MNKDNRNYHILSRILCSFRKRNLLSTFEKNDNNVKVLIDLPVTDCPHKNTLTFAFSEDNCLEACVNGVEVSIPKEITHNVAKLCNDINNSSLLTFFVDEGSLNVRYKFLQSTDDDCLMQQVHMIYDYIQTTLDKHYESIVDVIYNNSVKTNRRRNELKIFREIESMWESNLKDNTSRDSEVTFFWDIDFEKYQSSAKQSILPAIYHIAEGFEKRSKPFYTFTWNHNEDLCVFVSNDSFHDVILRYSSYCEDTDVLVRMFKLGQEIPESKHDCMVDSCNIINSRGYHFKYVIDSFGDLQAEYDFLPSISDSCFSEMAMEIYQRAEEVLNKEEAYIIKVLCPDEKL